MENAHNLVDAPIMPLAFELVNLTSNQGKKITNYYGAMGYSSVGRAYTMRTYNNRGKRTYSDMEAIN